MRQSPVIKICEYCGKEYRVHVNRMNTARFCSFSCKSQGYKIPELICLCCGKTFKARSSKRSDTGRQKFCSQKCNWSYSKTEHPSKECERCGKKFFFYPSRLKHGNPRYCSQSCAGNIRTSENERFRRLQTSEWDKIRSAIIDRDGGKCARCGTSELLTVHHIVKWAISKDDSQSNLITLCRSCHYSIEWNGVACPSPKIIF